RHDRRGGWALWRVLPRTLPYLKPYWKLGALSFVLMIVASVATMEQPWPMAMMLDVVDASGNRTLFGLSSTDKFTVLAIATALGFMTVLVSHGLTVINSYLD